MQDGGLIGFSLTQFEHDRCISESNANRSGATGADHHLHRFAREIDVRFGPD